MLVVVGGMVLVDGLLTAGSALVTLSDCADFSLPPSNGTVDFGNNDRSITGEPSATSCSPTSSAIGEFEILVVSLLTVALGAAVVLGL